MAANHPNITIPPGYKFHPTSPILIKDYLIRKINGLELPSNFIKDLDIFLLDPEQLPLDQFEHARANEGYFFTVKHEDSLKTRSTPSGYWKTKKENIPIYGDNEIIGFKNKLWFYRGTYPNSAKTYWKMTEYRCNPTNVILASSRDHLYVACKVGKIETDEDHNSTVEKSE